MNATLSPIAPAIRPPAVAGSFYPADEARLRSVVSTLLEHAGGTPQPARAAIVPHAGIEFSGQCAAHVFARVLVPKTVVILAPNHFGQRSQPALASIWQSGAFETPMGSVPIDETFATHLTDICPLIAHDPIAHEREHAVEVELPFLIARADAEFAIVPILLSTCDQGHCEQIAEAIVQVASNVQDEVLVLASTDMTHNEPATEAMRKDEAVLEALELFDIHELFDICLHEHVTMCGRAGVAITLEAARRLGARTIRVVDYRHSGFVTGNNGSVVGYAGVVIS